LLSETLVDTVLSPHIDGKEADDVTRQTEQRHLAVAAAVEFLAEEPGRIDRIRAKHYPLPGSDICAGCSAALTQHPCSATRIAELAKQWGGRS
jgi:hypothetical protein